MRLRPVAMVCIEALLNGQRRQLENLPTDCGFQRFQIEMIQILASEQRFDIPKDLSCEEVVE